jgi:signal transduction histidine kinase
MANQDESPYEARPGSASSYSNGGYRDVRDILLQISRDLATAQGRDHLLQSMTDAALRITPRADKCVVHLLNDEGTHLIPAVCSQPAPLPGEAGMSADTGIAGLALRECGIINVPDTHDAPGFAPLKSGSDLRSLLVAPLHVDGRRLGTLSVSSAKRAAFTPIDADLIEVLAAQASVAIEQARLLEQALRERERSEAVITSISEGLVVLNKAGYITSMNPALCAMLELAPEENLLPCRLEDVPGLRDLLPATTTIAGPFEAHVCLPSGRTLTARINAAKLYRQEAGQVITLHDVSEERQAAQARALFISQVSHELRTPLQHILSFTSLVTDLDDLSVDDQRHYVQHIEHEGRRLGRLVNDLVVLSSIETGHFGTLLERFDICELVENATARIIVYAQLLDIELALTCPARPVPMVSDAARVEQVLVNLVDNALKHVPAGGRIYVQVEPWPDDHVTVSVADNGPGIPADELPRIFESYYQASTTHAGRSNANARIADRYRGTGLGLYISRQIIEALGGSLWVKSEPGRGSTFSFRLRTTPE